MCQYSVFCGEHENEMKTGQKNLTFPKKPFEVSAYNLKFKGDYINRARGSFSAWYKPVIQQPSEEN